MDITELSDSHRVSCGTNLASLIDLSRLQTMSSRAKADDGDKDSPAIRIATIESMDEEEDESGWTTSLGNSDLSSDYSSYTTLDGESSSIIGSSSFSSRHSEEKSRSSSVTDSQEVHMCGVCYPGDSAQHMSLRSKSSCLDPSSSATLSRLAARLHITRHKGMGKRQG